MEVLLSNRQNRHLIVDRRRGCHRTGPPDLLLRQATTSRTSRAGHRGRQVRKGGCRAAVFPRRDEQAADDEVRQDAWQFGWWTKTIQNVLIWEG